MPDNPFPAFIKYHPAHSWETPDTPRREDVPPDAFSYSNDKFASFKGPDIRDFLDGRIYYKWKGTQLMMWHPADHWRIVEIDWERK